MLPSKRVSVCISMNTKKIIANVYGFLTLYTLTWKPKAFINHTRPRFLNAIINPDKAVGWLVGVHGKYIQEWNRNKNENRNICGCVCVHCVHA